MFFLIKKTFSGSGSSKTELDLFEPKAQSSRPLDSRPSLELDLPHLNKGTKGGYEFTNS